MSEQGTSDKLWSVGSRVHPLVERYLVGEDYYYDSKFLLPYDLQASLAHAQMLQQIGILEADEFEILEKALEEIRQLWQDGKFVVRLDQEDGHTAIEQYITKNYGDVGKKIHTGRSRNDQALVMLRLYLKERLNVISNSIQQLTSTFRFTIEEKNLAEVPMPGYTHMQKAMPTTVSCWLESYADALDDTIYLIDATQRVIDQNPLGSAAGFGVNHLKLQRDVTTQLLGFSQTQQNVMYCGFSRGYFENMVLQVLSNPMLIFSRFACDMMMFTQQETQFFSLPDEFLTGSSIMPQKKNYDLFEIMRSNFRVFSSYQFQIQQIVVSLGSGYHRDLQLTKKPAIEAIQLCEQTIELMKLIIPQIRVNQEKLKDAMTEELYLTDQVYKYVVDSKLHFREAYLKVKADYFNTHQQSSTQS